MPTGRSQADAGPLQLEDTTLPPSLLRQRLEGTMAALPPLPGHVADFVWASLVARGGAKSLAISDGAALVVEALRRQR